MTPSVVIPILNAERHLPALLDALGRQEPAPPGEILLLDSRSQDRSVEIGRARGARIVDVPKFSHGGTRNMGAREARGEVVVFLSQDALPADTRWLANLMEPFADPSVAAVFSRQIAYAGAKPMERYFLETHFPAGEPRRRRKEREGHLGFQDVFFSNVSSAVRREVMLRFPFDDKLIMSEDQQFARDILNAGYHTVYQPASVVYHSHDYSLAEVFRRYFDSVHSLTCIFPAHGTRESARIGLSYLFREMGYMLLRHPLWLPYYAAYVAARSAGTLAGHHADRLPRPLLKRLSMHAYHWGE